MFVGIYSHPYVLSSQEVYGLEKLYHEEMALAYSRDFPLVTRMARFHNVYGPFGKLPIIISCTEQFHSVRQTAEDFGVSSCVYL